MTCLLTCKSLLFVETFLFLRNLSMRAMLPTVDFRYLHRKAHINIATNPPFSVWSVFAFCLFCILRGVVCTVWREILDIKKKKDDWKEMFPKPFPCQTIRTAATTSFRNQSLKVKHSLSSPEFCGWELCSTAESKTSQNSGRGPYNNVENREIPSGFQGAALPVRGQHCQQAHRRQSTQKTRDLNCCGWSANETHFPRTMWCSVWWHANDGRKRRHLTRVLPGRRCHQSDTAGTLQSWKTTEVVLWALQVVQQCLMVWMKKPALDCGGTCYICHIYRRSHLHLYLCRHQSKTQTQTNLSGQLRNRIQAL